MPLGLSFQNKTFVWDEEIDIAVIQKRLSKKTSTKVIGVVSFVLGVLFIVLGLLLLLLTLGITSLFSLTFWFTPSLATLLLSFGLLALAFTIYHRVLTNVSREAIPHASPDELSQIEQVTSSETNVHIKQFFSSTSTEVVEAAFSLAQKFKHTQIEPLHLFVAAMADQTASVVFGRLGITFDSVKDPLGKRLATRQIGDATQVSELTERVLLSAFFNAAKNKRSEVSPLEIFFESYRADEYIQELLYDQGIDEQKFVNMIDWIRINEKMIERYKQFQKAAAFKPTGPMNRAMTSIATPILDAFSEDLTTAAVNGALPMLIGREKELESIFRIIEGGKQSVVLVGQNGVGKTNVLAGIAELMVEERVPDVLKDKRLVRLSIPHLIAGVDPAIAQQRLIQGLNEVAKSRNIILAVSDIEQMTGLTAGSAQTADLAATFVDFLSRSGTFAIATSTPQAYTAAVERSILGRVFQKVDVPEPDLQTAIQVLESKIAGIEYEHKVVFSYDAVAKAVELSDRFMHESFLPKKAINVASEVALSVSKTKGENALVTAEDVGEIVSAKTGVPVTGVQKDERDTLLHMEEKIHGRVIGQDEAVEAVSAALRRARSDMRSGDRPIATFLFLGSTGVGKTELAKTVSESYFGSEDSMIRFDMSEYQDPTSIRRFIGAHGSEQGGLLTEAIRQNPFSLLLLDELEKAHPEILNLFLQVFDDGRLTDATGRTIDFTNTIIIATSNAGTEFIQDALGQNRDIESIKTELIEEKLKGIYRPEFLNRFDGIIVFKPLSQNDVIEIAKLMIQKVENRLEEKGIRFSVTGEVLQELAQKGFDPKFGARPLRRVVQEEVENAIANALLEEKIQRRDKIVLEKGGKIRIEKSESL